jgi:hypothetical protein
VGGAAGDGGDGGEGELELGVGQVERAGLPEVAGEAIVLAVAAHAPRPQLPALGPRWCPLPLPLVVVVVAVVIVEVAVVVVLLLLLLLLVGSGLPAHARGDVEVEIAPSVWVLVLPLVGVVGVALASTTGRQPPMSSLVHLVAHEGLRNARMSAHTSHRSVTPRPRRLRFLLEL